MCCLDIWSSPPLLLHWTLHLPFLGWTWYHFNNEGDNSSTLSNLSCVRVCEKGRKRERDLPMVFLPGDRTVVANPVANHGEVNISHDVLVLLLAKLARMLSLVLSSVSLVMTPTGHSDMQSQMERYSPWAAPLTATTTLLGFWPRVSSRTSWWVS